MAFVNVKTEFSSEEMIINTQSIAYIAKIHGTDRIFFNDGKFFFSKIKELTIIEKYTISAMNFSYVRN